VARPAAVAPPFAFEEADGSSSRSRNGRTVTPATASRLRCSVTTAVPNYMCRQSAAHAAGCRSSPIYRSCGRTHPVLA